MKRFVGVLLVLSALLVFINACEAESDAAAAFRSGEYAESQLENTLEQRRSDEVQYLALEGGAFLMCLGGISVLVFRR